MTLFSGRWFALFVLFLVPDSVFLLADESLSKQKNSSSKSLSYITEDTIAAAVVRPYQILDSETVKPYSKELLEYLIRNVLIRYDDGVARFRSIPRGKENYYSIDEYIYNRYKAGIRISGVEVKDLREVLFLVGRKNIHDSSWNKSYVQAQEKQESTKIPNSENFKKIFSGFKAYHNQNKKLPRANGDYTGELTGLSWRVHLLPYIGEVELFEEFHLDEPWDSPHNKKLIKKIPDVYQSPGVKDKGKTSFHVFTGERTLFHGEKGLGLRDVIDGYSVTFLCVLAGLDKADYWTKPGGIPFSEDHPKSGLGKLENNTLLACMTSGDVEIIGNFDSIPDDQIGFFIKRNDGQRVDISILERKSILPNKYVDIPTLVVTSFKKWDQDRVARTVLREFELKEVQGKKCYYCEGYTLYFPNDFTLVFSQEKYLSDLLADNKNDNPIASKFEEARKRKKDFSFVADWMPEKDFLKRMLRRYVADPGLASPVELIKQKLKNKRANLYGLNILPQIKILSLEINISGVKDDPLVDLEIHPENSQAYETVKLVLNHYCQLLKNYIETFEYQKELKTEKFQNIVKSITENIEFKEEGEILHLEIPLTEKITGISNAIKPALNHSENLKNVKKVVYALDEYSNTLSGFPRPDADSYGEKNGFSWRVHILRFVGEKDLYEKFHFDEPWDSTHNKKLIPRMPDFYKTPGVNETGKTSLHVFEGEKTPLNREKGARRNFYVYSGISTILVVQAGPDKAEYWTKPGGLPFDQAEPMKALGKIEGDEFVAGFFNRSIRILKKEISQELLKQLIVYQKEPKNIIWTKSGEPEFKE